MKYVCVSLKKFITKKKNEKKKIELIASDYLAIYIYKILFNHWLKQLILN